MDVGDIDRVGGDVENREVLLEYKWGKDVGRKSDGWGSDDRNRNGEEE